MALNRIHKAIVCAAALLLAATAAQARKDDDESDSRKGRTQSSEHYRGTDTGRSRAQRDDRHEPVPDTRRYTPPDNSRGGAYYTEPRPRDDTRHYEVIPRRDETSDDSHPRGHAEAPPRYENESRYAPRGLSMSEAVTEAQRRSGGRVLSAEPGNEDGQSYYRVKVLSPEGRVQILYIDAR